MKNYEALMEEARFLSKHVRTDWAKYDMTERSDIPEVRVPRLIFSDEVQVEWMYEDVRKLLSEVVDTCFVRECQVKYNDNVYIFVISARVSGNVVARYIMDVMIPVGDGVGAKKTLFTERLSKCPV